MHNSLAASRRPIVALALCAGLLCLASAVSAQDLAIINARIYTTPDAAAIERGVVVVRDGRIAAVGAGQSAPAQLRKIDASGMTVLAGFWNSHVHLIPDSLQKAEKRSTDELGAVMREMFLRWGFTSVFDIASSLDNTLTLRRRIESGELFGPRILTVGDPFFPAGGTPVYIRDWFERHEIPSAEVQSPTEARTRAERQLERGADGVKLFTGAILGGAEDVLPMPAEIVTAVSAAAHARNAPAFAHPTTLQGLAIAVEGGVDVLAHTTPTGGPWSSETVRTLVRSKVALTPTLALFESELEKEDVPSDQRAAFLGAAQQQVKALAEAGGELLFGTDVGYIELFDPTLEYRLLHAAGLDFSAILRSLTTAPAARFADAERTGRIDAGFDADLVIVKGDPAQSIEALGDVAFTIRGGRVVYEARDQATGNK